MAVVKNKNSYSMMLQSGLYELYPVAACVVLAARYKLFGGLECDFKMGVVI